ncbi:AEC family transporter [Candidatus Saccharibacteria bacterium]|nr:AEC family transporter [Candidatus Saccharibacteria bacterium]MBR6122932.1 AEC family transporter [Candidatus Saccharibacteria bacterium]
MELNLSNFYSSLGIIALIVLLGFFLGKKNLIDEAANKKFVGLLLSVFMPASLFSAFPATANEELLDLFFLGLLAGFIVMLSLILLSKLIFNQNLWQKSLATEAQFAFIFNNATFLGYPIISTTFGEQGIIPYCGFIIAFNLALFSYGIWLFKRTESKHFLKKTLLNPNILAVVFGMLVFLFHVELPDVLTSSVKYVAGATTPLSLLCIGYMLSSAKLKKVLHSWRLLVISLIQLLLAPFLTYGLLRLLGFPNEVVIVCTLIQALPTATSLGLFAEKYGGRVEESSELVVISTLCSVLTLPLVIAILFG